MLPCWLWLLMLSFLMKFDADDGGDFNQILLRSGLARADDVAVDIDNCTSTSELTWY